MELQFKESTCPCLTRVLGEVRSLEQAQEIRLSDGMPDIGRVLCGWGQVVQRSKEWSADSVSLSAGMMVWVLYAPEDGTQPRWVEGWIPFAVQWDLPQTGPEGTMRVRCLTRFVDARSVSARKIMVRAGIGAMVEAYVPREATIYAPEKDPEDVELKKVRYPMRLPKEAGEKIFSMDEELTLPGTLPPMEKLVYYTMEPEIQEQRVMADKVVFRGSGKLHVLYQDGENRLHSWDFSLPISQYAELSQSHSGDAETSVEGAVTALELEAVDGTHLHLKCGLVGQYLVEDLEVLELVEDAYSPSRDLTAEEETLELPGVLEHRREMVPAEQTVAAQGETAVDVVFLPDFPRQRTLENGVGETLSGTFQILYYGSDGQVQAAVSRWEGEMNLPADANTRITALPLCPAEPQILMGGGDMKVRAELPMELTAISAAGLPMVKGLNLGEAREPDENRPSLILRRAGERDLWEIAKATGSTVGAIRSANHLQEDPTPGQMLLIPIL